MGDSIGAKGGLSVGTLGPCMKFGDQFRWISNEHVFGPAAVGEDVLHPDGIFGTARIGKLQTRHGIQHKRSTHLYWQRTIQLAANFGQAEKDNAIAMAEEGGLFVKNVRLITVEDTARLLNMRGHPEEVDKCHHISQFARIRPGNLIRMSGRTSGLWCHVRVGRMPDSLLENGHWLSEWAIEQVYGVPWADGTGTGAHGDSGAGVIHETDNTLCGIIWGRNHGQSPLKAYVTDIGDLDAAIHDDDPSLGPMGLQGCHCPRISNMKASLSDLQSCTSILGRELSSTSLPLEVDLRRALPGLVTLDQDQNRRDINNFTNLTTRPTIKNAYYPNPNTFMPFRNMQQTATVASGVA